MMVVILFGIFLFLTALGMPLAHAMLPAILVTLILGFNIKLTVIPSSLIVSVDQWIWLTMPLFLLLGNIMNRSGITDRLIDFCQALVGRIPGGLSHVGVATNILMAGMSGSCSADAAATGMILIPSMKKAGYPSGYASMLISASSIIATLIPPSLMLIVVAVICRLSILRLWLAGVVPGLLVGLALMVAGTIVAKKKGFGRIEERFSVKRVAKTGGIAIPALMLPIIILGGMKLGYFTPTEAGAIAVVYALFLGFVVYRKLTYAKLRDGILSTVSLTGPLMWIIATAIVFGEVVGRLNIGEPFTQLILRFSSSPIVFLAIVSVVIFFLGCIMEGTPIILIFLPLLQTVAQAYQIDLVYFGVFFIYLILIGQCTPPVAPSMFITNAIAGCSVRDYIKDGWPLLVTQFVLIPIFVLLPWTITWFPNLILGTTQ